MIGVWNGLRALAGEALIATGTALREHHTGFSEYEAGDYLEASGRMECDGPDAADSPATVFPPAAAGLSFTDWATPAICDVLANHIATEDSLERIVCVSMDGTLAVFSDWQEWREHVAPLIAQRLESAGVQRILLDRLAEAELQAARERVQQDMGASSFASELFPQHTKPLPCCGALPGHPHWPNCPRYPK